MYITCVPCARKYAQGFRSVIFLNNKPIIKYFINEKTEEQRH